METAFCRFMACDRALGLQSVDELEFTMAKHTLIFSCWLLNWLNQQNLDKIECRRSLVCQRTQGQISLALCFGVRAM